MTGSPADRIRPARSSDAEAVTRLVRRAYRHYVARIGREPAPMTADHDRAIAQAAVWVATCGDDLTGVLVLQHRSDHAFVENVAVDPDHRGRGVGAALLAFAEIDARAHGLLEMRLYTNERMTENLSYYARRGYVEAGRETEDGFRRVHFVKHLPAE